ncbi:MAG: response regulator [candidate division FCPU426 bacterium]
MNWKILVVDDDPAIGRLIKMSLEVDGYEVRVVTSGFEAVEQAEAWKPDLLVLDIMMPGMNGYEVCSEIRRRPQFKGTKIIFLTARGNPGDAQHGFSLGCDDYIIKPFDPDELLDKVKSLFSTHA